MRVLWFGDLNLGRALALLLRTLLIGREGDMALHRAGLACGLFAATMLSVGCATDDQSSTLDAIIPTKEALSVGMAGDDPADISRYLLASGASAPQLSPDGQQIIFRSSVTGVPQLWTLPVTGGAPSQLTFGNGITFARWLPS